MCDRFKIDSELFQLHRKKAFLIPRVLRVMGSGEMLLGISACEAK
jgi:hypothetical protein